MNLRILKKLSKRAASELERRGYTITLADGTERIDTPRKCDVKHARPGRSRLLSQDGRYPFVSPLPGTPLAWYRVSWEYDEWECETAHEVMQRELYFDAVDRAARAST